MHEQIPFHPHPPPSPPTPAPPRKVDLSQYPAVLDTGIFSFIKETITFHMAVISSSRCNPSQSDFVPGSPSDLRPRKPPRLATMRIASRNVGAFSGGIGFFVI